MPAVRPARLVLRPAENGSDRSVRATATAVVSGTAMTIPMLPTMARTTSTATTSDDAISSGSWRPAANSTMSGSDAPT